GRFWEAEVADEAALERFATTPWGLDSHRRSRSTEILFRLKVRCPRASRQAIQSIYLPQCRRPAPRRLRWTRLRRTQLSCRGSQARRLTCLLSKRTTVLSLLSTKPS